MSVLGQTKMAPNSRMAKPWPVRVGTLVSTSKNTISDRSSAVEPIHKEFNRTVLCCENSEFILFD